MEAQPTESALQAVIDSTRLYSFREDEVDIGPYDELVRFYAKVQVIFGEHYTTREDESFTQQIEGDVGSLSDEQFVKLTYILGAIIATNIDTVFMRPLLNAIETRRAKKDKITSDEPDNLNTNL